MSDPARSGVGGAPIGGIVRYGMLSLPLSFAGIPLYVHAPDFYVTEHGVSLVVIGLVLMFLRLFDAVQDPVIGVLSDRFSDCRILIMLIAALVLVIGFAAVFHPVGGHVVVWFAVAVLVATSAWSVLGINLNSLGGLWSDDYHERTRIAGVREAFGLVGLFVAVVLPGVLEQWMPSRLVFSVLGAVLAVLMFVGMTSFVSWISRYGPEVSGRRCLRVLPVLRSLDGTTRRFLFIYAVSMLASSFPAVLIVFYVRDVLGVEEYTGIFLAIYFFSGAAAMPLWQILGRYADKLGSWLASMLLSILAFVWAFVLGSGDVGGYGLICLLSGMAFGADLAIPPSILADLIEKRNERDHVCLHFGLLAFILKSAGAIASATGLIFLDLAGLVPGGDNDAEVLFRVSVAYALFPCAIKAVAAFMVFLSLPGAHMWRS